ncbi:FAD-binding protein [Sulfidibacter corallicola]|uniref:FAD-binding protein n=1 Tax=Sulfidibacter corallicola TaxID=2818388 RepID=A0A8A4TXD7_SULCO|nr:D-arabinono-1,4-lactone oxidase [Sulfidibacter corallicola]QTD53997.1 FAD-binding protein [Sulfidibacter corallicola]
MLLLKQNQSNAPLETDTGAAVPNTPTGPSPITNWSNWSGLVTCRPQNYVQPRSEEELAELVRTSRAEGREVRVVGSGHSFTPLVQTDDTLVNLDRLAGMIGCEARSLQATVHSGTKLHALGEMLFERGLAQENLGDINVQSIAGAISTGTHGTGIRFPGIAQQVIGMKLVDGKGEVVSCGIRENPELFNAARVSLGALGIISSLTLQCVPAYKLHYRSERATLENCLADLDRHREDNRNFEFYWFPYSDRVQLKFMNETDREPTNVGIGKKFNDVVLENYAFWLLSTACRWFPSLCSSVSKLCASLVSADERTDWGHRIYATPRMVRFQEMEYNIPREAFPEVVREIRAKTAERRFKVHFPLECRFAARDDIWLSPSHQRDSAYVAVHMFKGMPWQDYFQALEKIFLAYDGRPHWGKWHSLTQRELADRYPRWADFLELRATHDPDGVFLNSHLRRLFGL